VRSDGMLLLGLIITLDSLMGFADN
jgi:hypothetical protein